MLTAVEGLCVERLGSDLFIIHSTHLSRYRIGKVRLHRQRPADAHGRQEPGDDLELQWKCRAWCVAPPQLDWNLNRFFPEIGMMSVIHITNSQPLKVHELKHLSYTWGLLDKTFGLYEWRLKSFVTTASSRSDCISKLTNYEGRIRSDRDRVKHWGQVSTFNNKD